MTASYLEQMFSKTYALQREHEDSNPEIAERLGAARDRFTYWLNEYESRPELDPKRTAQCREECEKHISYVNLIEAQRYEEAEILCSGGDPMVFTDLSDELFLTTEDVEEDETLGSGETDGIQ